MKKLLPEIELKISRYKEILEEISYSRVLETGITIDGAESNDLDDGFSFVKSGDRYILKVYISDVSAIILPGSGLFDNALQRAETIYMKATTRPMLPKYLSEGLLSLLPGSPKPAMCFEVTLLGDGSILDSNFGKKAFVNRRRLSYPEFDDILKNQYDDPDRALFREMADYALMLLERRINNGAIAVFDIAKGIYSSEEGEIFRLSEDRANLGYIVVQEFMILINSAAAIFFAEKGIPALYRNHTASISAPPRNEIVEQIQIAEGIPSLLASLQQRITLWFNKAEYSPYLRGHYALNLPAFIHITSPIRRAADLINHQMLNAYLEGGNPPHSFDEMLVFSESINDTIKRRKVERSNYLKAKAETGAAEKIHVADEKNLIELSISDFGLLMKTAAKYSSVPNSLANSMIKRMENGTVSLMTIFNLLFKNNNDSPDWLELKSNVLQIAGNNIDTGVQLINILKQKGRLSEFKTEVKAADGCFLAATCGSIDGTLYDTGQYSYGQKKKEASQRSIYHFLLTALNFKLPADIVENLNTAKAVINAIELNNNISEIKIKESGQVSEPDIIEAGSILNQFVDTEDFESLKNNKPVERLTGENYTGRLLELYYKNKDWNEPVYEFFITGKPNSPHIVCRCKLETPTKTIIESVSSSNKKQAKHAASEKVLESLRKSGIVDSVNKSEMQCDISKTYVSMLLELCTKWGLKQPEYEYSQTGMQHKPEFNCRLSIILNEKVLIYEATGETKKAAKHNASQKCFEELSAHINRLQ